MAGSLDTGVRGDSGHVACVRFRFLFCHPPLHGMPHPPTREVLAEFVNLRCDLILYPLFCVIVRQLIRSYVKGQAVWFGLA